MTPLGRQFLSRRTFVLSAVAASAGCALRAGETSSGAAPAAPVRAPLVGQSWRYEKYDYISGAFVDSQSDRVAAVGTNVEIESHSDSGKDTVKPSWGAELLRKFRGNEATTAALPSEIQSPWGKVLVDPHWGQVQVYEMPIPLWPVQLRPGWRIHFQTRYKTVANEQSLPWEQTMEAQNWETVTSPAGQFKALRFTNRINFTHPDPARTNSVRRETMWFAPEIGRWVARESVGTYYLDDSVDDTAYNESSYRWKLTEWT
jgi:hypothetical protein